MYQPSHITTEIGRMRAEEMRARAERYRTIQKAKQHKKTEPEEEVPSRSRTFVYRKALGIVGLSLLIVLGFAAAALAMPADAGPTGVDDKEALVVKPQVREGPPSFWATQSAAVGGQERAEIQHLGDAELATVAGVFGGQERADIQHVGDAEPATVAGVFGGQERAGIQHVGDAEPATVAGVFGGQERAGIQHVGDAEPATVAGVFGGQERAGIQHVGEAQPQPSSNFEPSSGGIDLEIVLLTGTLALMAVGALLWFRRQTVKPA
jgi:hypothetical protein